MTLFIGILTGAILATTGFMIYTNLIIKQEPMLINETMQNDKQQVPGGQMQKGEVPEKPEGEDSIKKEEPPEKPEGEKNIV